jgi:hypothetical protein
MTLVLITFHTLLPDTLLVRLKEEAAYQFRFMFPLPASHALRDRLRVCVPFRIKAQPYLL